MSNRTKRLALIVLMAAVLVYTVINYFRQGITLPYLIVFAVILVPSLMMQVNALIQEWKEE